MKRIPVTLHHTKRGDIHDVESAFITVVHGTPIADNGEIVGIDITGFEVEVTATFDACAVNTSPTRETRTIWCTPADVTIISNETPQQT